MPPTQNIIDAPEADYLYTDNSQIPEAGQGLFTAIDIFKGGTIAVFEGEILTAAQAKQRAEDGDDRYFISLPNGSTLDSMHVLSFAKFANDAQGATGSAFKNNARIAIDDNNAICLQAIKKINVGKEVFCGYGKKYWDKHS